MSPAKARTLNSANEMSHSGLGIIVSPAILFQPWHPDTDTREESNLHLELYQRDVVDGMR